MLVLLPPSEGKATPPRRGRPVDIGGLSFPELTQTREQVLDALTALCADPARAVEVLELGPSQRRLVEVDARVRRSPTLPARRLYTGVLYSALGLDDLPAAATTRANRDLVVCSGLWGLLRLGDRIPAYRLPGGLSLPGLGPLARVWRGVLDRVLPDLVGPGPLLDLRSGTYAAAWSATGARADATVTVRVLSERDGRRSVVTEANKAVKGRLARAVLCDPARPPRTAERLVEAVVRLGEHPIGGAPGWRTEPGERVSGRPWRLDLVATDLTTRR